MRKIEVPEGLHWYRYTAFGGEEYGPYYLRDGARTIGSVNQCVGDKSNMWMTWVLPRVGGEKRSCYATSRERAMYFVQCWAKYNYKRLDLVGPKPRQEKRR